MSALLAMYRNRDMHLLSQSEDFEGEEHDNMIVGASSGSEGSGEDLLDSPRDFNRPTPLRLMLTAAAAASLAGLLLVGATVGISEVFHHGPAKMRGMQEEAGNGSYPFATVPDAEAVEAQALTQSADGSSASKVVAVTPTGEKIYEAVEKVDIQAPDAMDARNTESGMCGKMKCKPGSSCVNGICGAPDATRCGNMICGEDATCCGEICCGVNAECTEDGKSCLAATPAPAVAARNAPQAWDGTCGGVKCQEGWTCLNGVCGLPDATVCGTTPCAKGATCCGSLCCAREAGCNEADGGVLTCAAPPPRDAIIALTAPKVGPSGRCGSLKCHPWQTCVAGKCGAPDATQCGDSSLCGKGSVCCGSNCCAPGSQCGGDPRAPVCIGGL